MEELLVECGPSKIVRSLDQSCESESSQLQGHRLLVSNTHFVHFVMLNSVLDQGGALEMVVRRDVGL